jgi:hypothetical protein
MGFMMNMNVQVQWLLAAITKTRDASMGIAVPHTPP